MTLDDYIAALERLRRRHGGSIEVACEALVEYDEFAGDVYKQVLAPKPSTTRAMDAFEDPADPHKRVVLVA